MRARGGVGEESAVSELDDAEFFGIELHDERQSAPQLR
jgi:hypothetical protein